MFSYPLDFPTSLTVNSLRITPMNAVARSMSKFSFSEQVYDFGGEAWGIEGSMPLMEKSTADAYMSFILKLKGRRGTFLFPLPTTISSASGAWGGTPLVDGGSQTGNTLDIKGLPINTTGVAKDGDYINLGTGSNTRLYRVLEDADSDGSGNATITIWPALRTSPADNDAVIYQNVKVLLRLNDDVPIDIDVNKHYFIAFKAMEAL